MKTQRHASLACVAVLAAAAVGCAEGTTPGPFDDEGGVLPTPEVHVAPITFEVTAREANAGRAPIVGARCAVQVEGRYAVEATTGLEGTARFEIERWPATDALSVTCAERHATSWVGLRRADLATDAFEVLVAVDPPERAIETARLSGAIEAPTMAGELRLVQATNQLAGGYEGRGDAYELLVEAGVPFGVIATRFAVPRRWAPRHFEVEVLDWAAFAHRPIQKEGHFDVGFADPVEPAVARGAALLPEDPEGVGVLFGDDMWGRAFVYPKAAPESVVLGFARETALVSDAPPGERSMRFVTESIEAFFAEEEVYTELTIEGRAFDAPYSSLFIDGYPSKGVVAERFLEPPRLVEPIAEGPLSGALLRWAPDETSPNLLRVEDATGRTLTVLWEAGQEELVVPDLPVTWARELTRPLSGRLMRAERGENDASIERIAATRALSFTR